VIRQHRFHDLAPHERAAGGQKDEIERPLRQGRGKGQTRSGMVCLVDFILVFIMILCGGMVGCAGFV
jgi:hypothetical protein